MIATSGQVLWLAFEFLSYMAKWDISACVNCKCSINPGKPDRKEEKQILILLMHEKDYGKMSEELTEMNLNLGRERNNLITLIKSDLVLISWKLLSRSRVQEMQEDGPRR